MDKSATGSLDRGGQSNRRKTEKVVGRKEKKGRRRNGKKGRSINAKTQGR